MCCPNKGKLQSETLLLKCFSDEFVQQNCISHQINKRVFVATLWMYPLQIRLSNYFQKEYMLFSYSVRQCLYRYKETNLKTSLPCCWENVLPKQLSPHYPKCLLNIFYHQQPLISVCEYHSRTQHFL